MCIRIELQSGQMGYLQVFPSLIKSVKSDTGWGLKIQFSPDDWKGVRKWETKELHF